jgi:hypothetical protein
VDAEYSEVVEKGETNHDGPGDVRQMQAEHDGQAG